MPNKVHKKDGAKQTQRLAKLGNLAARHFNNDMRAYYFALAKLSWFFNAWGFLITTGWVILVLYRREFYPKALRILR